MIQAPDNFLAGLARLDLEPEMRIEIAGYARVFTWLQHLHAGVYPWINSIEDQGITVSDLDGGADLGQLTFTIQDRRGVITGDFPSFVFEGKKIVLKTGFAGLDPADYLTLFTGKIDAVNSVDRGKSYAFVCSDAKADLSGLIFETGDDGFPIDSDHKRTIQGHPLDIVETVLIQERGYSEADVNLAKLHDYRDTIYSGLFFSFVIDSAPEAKEFLESEICKVLGFYIWTNNLGVIDFNFFYPRSTAVVMDIPERYMRETPDAMQSDLIDVVTFKFDVDDNSKFFSQSIQNYSPSISKYGQVGAQTIESKGMRSAFAGFYLAAMTSRLLFFRYGSKNMRIEGLGLFWRMCLLEPGDFVTASFETLPDRDAGTIGISKRKFEVLDPSRAFGSGVVELTLIDAAFLDRFGSFLITEDSQADFTASTTHEKNTLMYLSGGNDKYSDGSAGHVLA